MRSLEWTSPTAPLEGKYQAKGSYPHLTMQKVISGGGYIYTFYTYMYTI